MPLLLDATAMRVLARGLRVLAIGCRQDAERHGPNSVSARHALEYAELYDRRARALDELAGTGQEFELRRRG